MYGAPVGAVEAGGGTDVEQDHGVSRAEVILDGPADGVGALVAEIDGDSDLALGAEGRGGDEGEARGGRLQADGAGGGLGVERRFVL